MNALIDEPHILLVDDNPGDIELTRMALADVGRRVRITSVMDGVEAQEQLRVLGAKGECPAVIILDLNMPRASGLDVLAFLESHGHCSQTVVVVLTTSTRQQDRERSLRLGAAEVMTKPDSFGELVDLMRRVGSYLPSEGGIG